MGAFQTLGHINFKTRDLNKSIAFYQKAWLRASSSS